MKWQVTIFVVKFLMLKMHYGFI